MTPFLSTNTAVAGAQLADAPPVITGAAADAIVHALDLDPQRVTPRVPAWITDPDTIRSILLGHIDVPDDFMGGAR
ncbi:hypothetical protein [Streptomyces sp. NBC_01716]|uniref:hypothetical protein n=1 Tax=Streptomyces sp. NBC_01716 TaxID=2975917 RepID=UPI002E33A8CF|nr:hypothetical protein [Streptomyces sp. NBC_01716]